MTLLEKHKNKLFETRCTCIIFFIVLNHNEEMQEGAHWSDDQIENPLGESWQYTVDDWIFDNEDALLMLYEDMQKGILSIGANILTDCNFPDFCKLVQHMSWIPEIGLHVPSRQHKCSM